MNRTIPLRLKYCDTVIYMDFSRTICVYGAIKRVVKNYGKSRLDMGGYCPESPYISLSDGYAGDGGIPGYIVVSLVPNEYTMSKIQVALAHECNHNVRFQFEKWKNDITLGEMMICEGLAENFATSMFSEDMVGPWVSKTEMDTLNNYIKPLIKDVLDATGFDNISAYLWGDELAQLQGFFPQGMPYCAGYACGYHMIKHYLKKTGKSVVEATLTPASDILKEIEDFWNEESA